MSKIKLTYNKVYKYVHNTHPFNIFMDMVMTALGTLAFGGIAYFIYGIIVWGITVDICCY
jgi:hypothetical protein